MRRFGSSANIVQNRLLCQARIVQLGGEVDTRPTRALKMNHGVP